MGDMNGRPHYTKPSRAQTLHIYWSDSRWVIDTDIDPAAYLSAAQQVPCTRPSASTRPDSVRVFSPVETMTSHSVLGM